MADASGTRVDKLEKENQDLKSRLDALEAVAKKEGLVPSGSEAPLAVKAMSDITISGFASASYFFDTSEPKGNVSPGYLWSPHNNFTLNKVKLTIASKPVEQSGEKFDAGFRTSLIFGQDAPIVNTGGTRQGFNELREAFVEANIPIGTGLNVKAGQLISLLNFESGDGGVANPNFSQGNQWFFTGNGPSTGVQLGYNWSETVSTKARIDNGLYTGPVDGNGFKSFMGSVDIKPDAKTGLSFIGFGGREGGSTSSYLKGASFIGTRQLTEKYNINLATELDYFSPDTSGGGNADFWSVGGWVWADITSKVGVALRGDFVSDSKGAAVYVPDSKNPGKFVGLLGFQPDALGQPRGQDMASLTFTLNIKPAPNFKFQPEIRYDHTSMSNGFDGKEDRVIVGAGVSYMF